MSREHTLITTRGAPGGTPDNSAATSSVTGGTEYAARVMVPPNTILELADACAVAVENAVGAAPDFTQDTLPLVDHWISLADVRGGALMELLAPMAGAYFGEVCRRQLLGFGWHHDAETRLWRLELSPRFFYFNPAGVALEAFLQEDALDWSAHLRTLPADESLVKELLERAGEVREDDYRRLSVRYEVIELVHATMIGLAANEGDPTHIPTEAYQTVADADERALAASAKLRPA